MQKKDEEHLLKNISQSKEIDSCKCENEKLKKEFQNMKVMYDIQLKVNLSLRDNISMLQVSNDKYLKERNVILFL